MRIASQIPNSDQSPLYDVRNPARASDKDATCEVMFRGRYSLAIKPGDQWSARLRSFELRRGSLRSREACPAVAGAASEGWWSQTGSNRRPHACKARALPAELWPRTRRRMLQAGCKLDQRHMRSIKVVGLGRLELPTSRLSSARSNQLSYKPLTRGACSHAPASRRRIAQAQPLARVRPRRKRNVDGEIPPMELNDLAIVGP
jgi:hypothetical protein